MDELAIRLKIFEWLRARSEMVGGIFGGRELMEGVDIEGRRITLKGTPGIWIPKGFSMPISITTVADGPYRLDDIGEDGILTYAYRGQDPTHRDNRGLQEAKRTRTPLIYFKEVHHHRYQAIFPLIIIDDDPAALCVRACLDPAYNDLRPGANSSDISLSPDLRRYAWGQARHRLHQEAFRDIVVEAYDERCAVCRLHHRELLDAAHIIPDSDDLGEPVVQNGLSLCKIHHATYDCGILGVSPDYEVRIQSNILKERDGPMLRHGLQELEGSKLVLPTRREDWPDRDRLALRFQEFMHAS